MSALAIALLLFFSAHPASSKHVWHEQRDDISEYNLNKYMRNVDSKIECAALASPEHQAVEFSHTNGTCRMYSCQLGWSGCRKCRNARNSSLPLLLVRRVDQLGHTCWRTFQHRVDGSVDFYRKWTDYVAGFGEGPDHNYWMGLEAIHQLTKAGDKRVRWEFSTWNGSWYWWENSYFAVYGAGMNYSVSIGEQVMDRSNVINTAHGWMNNRGFTTKDKDHDPSDGNCANSFIGAWWYENCHSFNPNGPYIPVPLAFNVTPMGEGITFHSDGIGYPFNGHYSMRIFECLVPGVV